MSGYGRFACYYDKLTENVDYGKIAARCHELIKRYSSEHEVVLDLACGTGSLSASLSEPVPQARSKTTSCSELYRFISS